MALIHDRHVYEKWAPVIARYIFAFLFLLGAAFKIMGNAQEVGMTAAMGVPYAHIAVILAFILELVAGIALIVGFETRITAFLLAIYTFALALIFYHHISDPQIMGEFVSHLGLIAGLLYVSVYGAQHAALQKDGIIT